MTGYLLKCFVSFYKVNKFKWVLVNTCDIPTLLSREVFVNAVKSE